MEDENNLEGKKFGRDLKIIIVGDLSTGKTSILDRYINKKFERTNKATLSPQFSYKIINSNGVIYRIQFWDIPGQSRTAEITGIFCRDSQGIIFCMETGNMNSRANIEKWEQSLLKLSDIKNTPKILIENKCDLLGDENNYNKDFDSLKKFSDNHEFLGCFRTSALNGYNVEKAINFLIDEIIKSQGEDDAEIYKSKSIKVNISTISNKKKERCC